MSKSNETAIQTPDAVKKAGCCCGNQEKDHKQPGSKEQSKPSDTAHTAHTSQTQVDAGCCGGSKARK